MANLLIVCWTYNTQDPAGYQKDIDARFKALSDNLTLCINEVTALGAGVEQGNAFHAIFVAPEYLFTKAADDRQPLSFVHKELLYQKLLGLSKTHKKILIAPGTIYFAEDVVTEPERRKALSNLFMAEIQARRLLDDSDIDDVVKGWSFEGTKVPALKDIVKVVLDPNSATSRARNVAYLLLGGVRQAMYDKQVDFIETRGASPDKLAFIPGTHDQCPEIGEFKVGVEICFDHRNGILSKREIRDLDFHLVVSDWVSNKPGLMAMANGGYFIHASSNSDHTCVYARTATGALEKLDRYKSVGTEGNELEFWQVPIAVRSAPSVVAPPVRPTTTPPPIVTRSGVKLPANAVKVLPDLPAKKQ